jgi:NO-binding membrane sensor protein with MHYT domain
MTIGDFSLLLWVMAAVVALLSSYLFIGWVRRAQAQGDWRQWVGLSVLGGCALGLGISSAMVLAMSAEALAFPLGYRWIALPALFLAPPLLCTPAALWLSRSRKWPALLGAGLILTTVAVATHCGWLLAAGLRPGLRWNFQLVGAAAALGLSGFTAALWLAYSDASGDGARKTLWRVGAAVLMALTLVAGQEVIVSAVSLLVQVGSVYQREASSTWLCLVAGALVPIVMAVLALDLGLRNKIERRRRSGSGNSELGPRRKRRRKYRTL